MSGCDYSAEAEIRRAEGEGEVAALRGKFWTPEEDTRLRMFLGAGEPIEIVAADLNRSVAAVMGRAYILRISLKRVKRKPRAKGEMRPLVASPGWTLEEDELLLALALSGTSVAAMAKRLRRSRSAVYGRAGRLKIVLAKSRRLKAKGK